MTAPRTGGREDGMPQGNIPRRVVTGHDANGLSIVVSDGVVPVHRVMPEDGVGFYEVWQTSGAPAPISADEPDPTVDAIRVPPPVEGTKVRINEFFPGHLGPEGRQSPVHRTESVDYGIVLEGEIVLILDESETTLRTGDICIQRGTDHAWANRTDEVCRMAFILIDGRFDEGLLSTLPADVRDELMTQGPHDVRAGTGAKPASDAPAGVTVSADQGD
ncbi:cupin domain-containing protein [Microbacterium horticulturae]|uniref:Cupin domain-containing protein n=1 Tax=Microbacterium horticulturae TaxID=3028316 RepID=A0ABY8C0S8_9MICO|nr:cupin domain-containing protein [Microbacterium sp. KACC 23027]WEG08458.1 cupin domain-containing protein [Microbacterium sp. KACC 23027]